ncbi:MAG: DUF2934 domain-containing protein [Gammaproteobacteria bacterium]
MGATTAAAKTEKPARKATRKSKAKSPSVTEEQRIQMIEEAAYFKAEQRGFEDGDPVADWLTSEQEVDGILSQNPH